MSETKQRVAIVGCGRMGQHYAEAYTTYPDTEVVAIVEHDPERRQAVGERERVLLRVDKMTRLRTSLVTEDGKPVWTPVTRVIFPLSR